MGNLQHGLGKPRRRMLRLTVMRTTTKWAWVGTRMSAAAARTMMTTRRRAPATKREATKSKFRSFSFTVILFCLHIPSILRLPPTLSAFCLLKQSLGLPYLYSPKMRHPPSSSSATILISAIKSDRICWCGCVGEPYAAVLQGTAVLLLALLQYFHVPPESVPMVALPVYTFLRSTTRKLYIFFRRKKK